jgi:hypothetical protein
MKKKLQNIISLAPIYWASYLLNTMLEAEKEEKVARHNLRRERHTEPINLYARKTLIEKLENIPL